MSYIRFFINSLSLLLLPAGARSLSFFNRKIWFSIYPENSEWRKQFTGEPSKYSLLMYFNKSKQRLLCQTMDLILTVFVIQPNFKGKPNQIVHLSMKKPPLLEHFKNRFPNFRISFIVVSKTTLFWNAAPEQSWKPKNSCKYWNVEYNMFALIQFR